MPNGTPSLKLPIRTGRNRPRTSINQIAAAKAQATCVPMPSERARLYMRAHHSSTEIVRNRPVICHQPPSFIGAIDRPYPGAGGSRLSQNN